MAGPNINSKLLPRLEREAEEAEERLLENPFATVEVSLEAAKLMGAFREPALGVGGSGACEPGALDWLFGPKGGKKGSGGGDGLD